MASEENLRRRVLAVAGVSIPGLPLLAGATHYLGAGGGAAVPDRANVGTVQPVANGSDLWPYTGRSERFGSRTLAIDVIAVGAGEHVRREFRRQVQANWTTRACQDPSDDATAGDESAARAGSEPILEIVDQEIVWLPAHGATRYTYVRSATGAGQWLRESYRLYDGTYLGTRHHVRAYDSADDRWTAAQGHRVLGLVPAAPHRHQHRRHAAVRRRPVPGRRTRRARLQGPPAQRRQQGRQRLGDGDRVRGARGPARDGRSGLGRLAGASAVRAGLTLRCHGPERYPGPTDHQDYVRQLPIFEEIATMSDRPDVGDRGVTRRDLLAAGAALTTGLASGCLQRVRSLVDRQSPDQLSLQIKTLPADADEPATRIARLLADHMETVGIDAEITLLREDELRRDVLTNGEFELYVYRMPLGPDPDFLRPRLHSVFKGEAGWQNPFGLTDLDLDEQLGRQRRTANGARRAVVSEVQETVAQLQPFVALAVPDEISATRDDRFENWDASGLATPLSYLRLDSVGSTVADRLRVVATDDRITTNLNPIAVTFRDRGTVTGLLYEPLGRRIGELVRPWLAGDWEWSTSDGTASVRIDLREDLTWHDGEALTAEDVAFTYRFLNDTTLGEREAAVPAPRYRGRTSLVEGVRVRASDVVEIGFGETTPQVGARALTVPILPEHVWREQSTEAELAGVGVNERVTEALVWDNREPIGSGPLSFGERPNETALTLERFDDHFLHRAGADAPVPDVEGGVDFASLSLQVAPSMGTAVELVGDDAADATTPGTDPAVVPQIGQASALSLRVGRSPWLYHVGFDTGMEPLGNPHVRRTVARLLDKDWIVDEVLDGYGRPAATPLAGTDWVPDGLTWQEEDPEIPFVGTDGELEVDAARDLFRDIGFQYENDRLLSR